MLLMLLATGTSADEQRLFDIAPQALPTALELLIDQAGIELLYDSDAVEGKITPGVVGRFTIAEAVDRVLRGTGLNHTFTTPTTVAIQAWAPAAGSVPVDPYAGPGVVEGTLPALLVSATRGELGVHEAPAAANVVMPRDIQSRHVSTLDQALNLTPGGYFRRGKGLMDTASNISLRGFPTTRRTAILLNGIPLNDTYTGDANFSSINLDDVERIEVVRGPFSSLYGGNAMGGVVNVITKETTGTDARLKLGFGDAFETGAAPANLVEASFAGGLQLAPTFGLRASVSQRTTDGYPTNFVSRTAALPAGLTGAEATTDSQGNPRLLIGHSGDNSYEDDNLTLAGRYRFAGTDHIGVSFTRSRSQYDYEDPRSFLRNSDGDEQFITSTGSVPQDAPTSNYLAGPGGTKQDQFTSLYTSQWDDISSTLTLGYIDQYDGWFVTPAATAAVDGGPGTGSKTETSHRILDWQIEAAPGARHMLTTGVFYRRGDARNSEHSLSDWTDRDSETALTYEAEGRELAYALFVQDRFDITESITAYLGARQDWWETSDGLANSAGVSGYPIRYPQRSDSRFSPKAALIFQHTPTTRYRLAAGRSFRAPAVFELYRTWLSPSSGTTFQSNPALDPETAASWEAGLDRELPYDTRLSATYFSNRMRDFIYRTEVSSTPPVQRFENAAEAHSRGVELNLTGRIARVNWQASYTLTDARIDSNPRVPASEGKQITQIPRNVASASADWRRDRLSLGGSIRYADERYNRDDNSDDVHGVPGAYDGYTLVDIKIGYQLTADLNASLSIDNLTDKEWYDFYLAHGRSWFAQLYFEL
jgi:iron complex outermembrane receptor protein